MFLMSIIARAALVMPTINSEMATAYRIERRIEVCSRGTQAHTRTRRWLYRWLATG
ncbi:hypothetical protein KC19_1G173200 [Ceratodon purpureus]|uniref:Uncharacterized protein n=1 Tax=Ceratodon purpureus TaxID=3225 RepID=A0A8T0J650_CERPU|nr:hypothetical protein KC19_1G173200 [Ceratodon purpureus]